jgi:hypothetical protein
VIEKHQAGLGVGSPPPGLQILASTYCTTIGSSVFRMLSLSREPKRPPAISTWLWRHTRIRWSGLAGLLRGRWPTR